MNQKEGIGLAFLDMLSCALGAMILLFLIFSTFQHQGIPRPGRNQPAPDLSEAEMRVAVGQGESDPRKMPHLWQLKLKADEAGTWQPEAATGQFHIGRMEHRSGAYLIWIDDPSTAGSCSFEVHHDQTIRAELEELQPGRKAVAQRSGTGFRFVFTMDGGWSMEALP
ncbi:hypothetical protein SCOR_28550 [Sulfidibacter corallicola]|uniref:Uncharacterized protein n=1 Tax=Sulfidibacter corallicola TaxID=2818388 RepID=A0A8A4TLQ3_SULCO|nr:hypothetical protein [Sulfidibacter corallicola]QTD50493.1 hypothetical protein J3U87_33330 [Sulfidibacter corallicola]